MTTLNTIIEEEKNGVVYEEAVDFAESAKVLHISDVEKLLTTAMQRAYGAGETQAYRRGYEQGRFDSEMDVLRDIPPPDHFELDQDKK